MIQITNLNLSRIPIPVHGSLCQLPRSASLSLFLSLPFFYYFLMCCALCFYVSSANYSFHFLFFREIYLVADQQHIYFNRFEIQKQIQFTNCTEFFSYLISNTNKLERTVLSAVHESLFLAIENIIN